MKTLATDMKGHALEDKVNQLGGSLQAETRAMLQEFDKLYLLCPILDWPILGEAYSGNSKPNHL